MPSWAIFCLVLRLTHSAHFKNACKYLHFTIDIIIIVVDTDLFNFRNYIVIQSSNDLLQFYPVSHHPWRLWLRWHWQSKQNPGTDIFFHLRVLCLLCVTGKSPNLAYLCVKQIRSTTFSQPTWILSIEQNMFLAIINDTYSEVKEELASQNDDLHITDLFKQVKLNT